MPCVCFPQVELYPLKINLSHKMYRAVWRYFFPKEPSHLTQRSNFGEGSSSLNVNSFSSSSNSTTVRSPSPQENFITKSTKSGKSIQKRNEGHNSSELWIEGSSGGTEEDFPVKELYLQGENSSKVQGKKTEDKADDVPTRWEEDKGRSPSRISSGSSASAPESPPHHLEDYFSDNSGEKRSENRANPLLWHSLDATELSAIMKTGNIREILPVKKVEKPLKKSQEKDRQSLRIDNIKVGRVGMPLSREYFAVKHL